MAIEKIIRVLVYAHATFRGIALLSGLVALIAKKGKSIHKKSGLLFFYSMLVSAFIALVVAMLPNHFNPFLFAIGIFSSYFLLSGYRSIKFKQNAHNYTADKIIAIAILATGIFMVLWPIIIKHQINIVLLVFGSMSLAFGISDLLAFRNINELKKSWLKMHLGKMTGGYISAVSAFFVVNNVLPGIWNWFTPGIIGSIYITYWMRKLKK